MVLIGPKTLPPAEAYGPSQRWYASSRRNDSAVISKVLLIQPHAVDVVFDASRRFPRAPAQRHHRSARLGWIGSFRLRMVGVSVGQPLVTLATTWSPEFNRACASLILFQSSTRHVAIVLYRHCLVVVCDCDRLARRRTSLSPTAMIS